MIKGARLRRRTILPLLRRIAFPHRRPRQRPDRRRPIMQFDVRVNAHRQPDIAMPSQDLGHFRPNPRPFETGDEKMPHAVEIGEQPVVVAVA